jgi:hypothetical protein
MDIICNKLHTRAAEGRPMFRIRPSFCNDSATLPLVRKAE